MPARKRPAVRKSVKPARTAKASRARPALPRTAQGGGITKALKAGKSAATSKGAAVRSITPFLWFDQGQFEPAARFYVSLFPDSRIDGVHAMGGSFTLAGQRFLGLNGGPQYRFSPAVSFFAVCRDQAEVDRLWAALEKGGKPSRCGWIDDKFGLTWQIVPEAFLRLTSDPDPRKVAAVFEAMMGMVKMDVKGLQAAYDAA
jgi:predicted 3-demethylubiquinone-9 3-methyltransferase (glyoxalase superfamily)